MSAVCGLTTSLPEREGSGDFEMEFVVSKRCCLASSSPSLGTSLSMAGLFLCCAFGDRNLHYLQICVYTEFNHRSHKMSCLVKLEGVI